MPSDHDHVITDIAKPAFVKPLVLYLTFVCIVVLLQVGAVILLGMYSSAVPHEEDTQVTKFLQQHQCVVAQMEAFRVKSYRCDAPTVGDYVLAANLYEAAGKPGPFALP
jgi:hypothetical protein